MCIHFTFCLFGGRSYTLGYDPYILNVECIVAPPMLSAATPVGAHTMTCFFFDLRCWIYFWVRNVFHVPAFQVKKRHCQDCIIFNASSCVINNLRLNIKLPDKSSCSFMMRNSSTYSRYSLSTYRCFSFRFHNTTIGSYKIMIQVILIDRFSKPTVGSTS